MSDFGTELARLMQVHGVGVRELARAAYCNPGHVSNLRSGTARPSPQLAETLDRHLGAGGTLAAIAARSASARRRGRVTRSSGPSRAVEALQVAMNDNGDGLDIAEDGLAELVRLYAHAVAVAPSVAVYDELVSARSFAGTLLDRGGRARRPELAVTTGWLSSLLAISATDLGDHAAAVVWCADTERRGRDAGYPELLGWAALTRSLIAWYQGDPVRSAAAARRRAAAAMSQLGPSAPASGIYSVQRAEADQLRAHAANPRACRSRARRDRRGGSGRGGGAGIGTCRVADHGAGREARPVAGGTVARFRAHGGFPRPVHRRGHAAGTSRSRQRRREHQ
jgi:hypothetical protein